MGDDEKKSGLVVLIVGAVGSCGSWVEGHGWGVGKTWWILAKGGRKIKAKTLYDRVEGACLRFQGKRGESVGQGRGEWIRPVHPYCLAQRIHWQPRIASI